MCTARLGLQLRRSQRGIGRAEKLEPEGQSDRVDGRRARQTALDGAADVRRRSVWVDAEEAAGQLDDGVEGEHASVGERAGIVERHASGALDELVTQAALSRARLRGEQDDGRPTGLRVAQSPLQQRELGFPADEARETPGARTVEAAPDRTRTPQVEHPHRDARTLEVLLPAVEEVEETRREPC